MDLYEKLAKEYAKKIFGFAYSKTKNFHDAEDLSQDIILALYDKGEELAEIENMDAYIWCVSNYTWSNFLRKNKPMWNTLENAEAYVFARDSANVEEDYIKKDLCEKMRREVMYLSKMRRDITVMYYYENKSGAEIAEQLGIPAATVRWHMGETKKLLKERIDMTDTIYTPKKLQIFFSGNANDMSLAGLRNDLLTQNICIVCSKKALTVEEMAAEMGMNAAFIENKLGALLYMNYLEKVGTNKYKTTFFIKDAAFVAARKRFEMENLPPIARAIYKAIKNHLEEIKAIGFLGADISEDALMWTLSTRIAHDYSILPEFGVPFKRDTPMRGDGSRHWIKASYSDGDIKTELFKEGKELWDYVRLAGGKAGAHSSANGVCFQQFDPPVLCTRNLTSSKDIVNLKRIYTIIKDGCEISEHDREIIAIMVRDGYVRVRGGRPEMCLPFMSKEEYARFCDITKVILSEVIAEVGIDIGKRYAEYIKKYIPEYLSDVERDYQAAEFYEPNAFAYLLYKEGLLHDLPEDEKKSVCSIAWEI
ncbi:MAG: RNA polymerase sigma factor [Clostridia bacterium]|nr:RNA polymerase sigma factor [Clostridia bacterium]